MRHQSFTVIELLVVIAVIGLLSSTVLAGLNLPLQKYKARIARGLSFGQSVQNILGAEAAGIWNFDEGSGNTAKDSSGYNSNGAIYGASYNSETPNNLLGAGSGKYALYFNGLDNSIIIPSSKIGTENQMTVEVWVLPYNQIAGSFDFSKDIVRSNCYGGGVWGITTEGNFNSNGQLYILIGWLTNTPNPWRLMGAAGAITKDQWNYLVLSMDRVTGEANFYKDGQLVYSSIEQVDPKPVTTGLAIGYDCAGPFKGIIDNVGIYNQALTLGEIQKHYAEGLKERNNLAQK